MSQPRRAEEVRLLEDIRDGVNTLVGMAAPGGAIIRAAEIRAAATERAGERMAEAYREMAEAQRETAGAQRETAEAHRDTAVAGRSIAQAIDDLTATIGRIWWPNGKGPATD